MIRSENRFPLFEVEAVQIVNAPTASPGVGGVMFRRQGRAV